MSRTLMIVFMLSYLVLVCMPSVSTSRDPLKDGPDVRINATDPSGVETESAVYVSRINADVVLVSNNKIAGSGSGDVSAWISFDGGVTWVDNSSFQGAGDPTVSISADKLSFGTNGLFVVAHLDGKIRVDFNEDLANGWDSRTVPGFSAATDKPHIWIDNSEYSTGQFDAYVAWTDGGIRIARAIDLDSPEPWNQQIQLFSATLAQAPGGGLDSWGVVVQTGRTGRVYVTYPIQNSNDGGPPANPDGIVKAFGFRESPASLFAFAPELQLLSGAVGAFNGANLSGKTLRANSSPAVAVDKSDPNEDHLFLVWAGIPPGKNRPDIRMIHGTADLLSGSAVSWNETEISTVNQDDPSADNDQWWPWISWDNCTDQLVVVYMDSRANAGTQAVAETFVGVSADHGQSWTEVAVSDTTWCCTTPTVNGLPRGYDYIGIDASDGRAFPVWSDDRDGEFRPYTSPILLWGIEQNSVSLDFDSFQLPDSLQFVGNWTTNIDADEGDRLLAVSPGGDSTFSASTSGAAISHESTVTVPCQVGAWTFITESNRCNCMQPRTSDAVQVSLPAGRSRYETSSATTREIVWVDYDDDGDDDLYIANGPGANVLLRNDGIDDFTDVTTTTLGNTGVSHSAAWGDYNRDGDPDLYIANALGANNNKLLRNDAGVFVDVTIGPLADFGDARDVSWVDFNNDGWLDLYIVNYNGANKLLRNDGCSFADATTGFLGDTGNGQSAAWGDYNNDGLMDVYIVNQNEANTLLQNDGNGVFSEVFDQGGELYDSGDGQSASWGDYDNDGDLDIVLTNFAGGLKILRNLGGGDFGIVSLLALDDVTDAEWADHDNDGDLDLYVAADGVNQLLENNGAGFTSITDDALGDAGDGRAVAWTDYDGDGVQELFLANNGVSKALQVFDCLGHWLQLELKGTDSNRGAIGARARVVSGTLSQIREVSGHSSPILDFGLGTATVADSVIISWPSGVTTTLVSVSADTMLTIEECVASAPQVIESSMSGWASSGVSGTMTLHFDFEPTHFPTLYEVKYRKVRTSTWTTLTCSGTSGSCFVICDGSVEATASYSPCETVKFEWQAQAHNCQGASGWSSIKTFTAQCLEGP